jgi:phospholipase D1/2
MSQARIDLTVEGREPRGALDVVLVAPEGPKVRVIVVHLGLAPWERREQARRLVRALATAQPQVAATVLLGDLNEWLLWGRPLRWLHAALGKSAHIPTFPSRAPVFALDRIWVKPRTALRNTSRTWSAATRVASDHLPLVAEVALPTKT